MTALTNISQSEVDTKGIRLAQALQQLHRFSVGAALFSYSNDWSVVADNLALVGEASPELDWARDMFKPIFRAEGLDLTGQTSGTVLRTVGLSAHTRFPLGLYVNAARASDGPRSAVQPPAGGAWRCCATQRRPAALSGPRVEACHRLEEGGAAADRRSTDRSLPHEAAHGPRPPSGFAHFCYGVCLLDTYLINRTYVLTCGVDLLQAQWQDGDAKRRLGHFLRTLVVVVVVVVCAAQQRG